MATPWAAIIIFDAIFVAALFALFGWWFFHRVNARSARGIVDRLEATGGPYCVKAGYIRGVWNPAKPLSVDNPIADRGLATYTLDWDGVVHLHFQPRSGIEHRLSGPIPDVVRSPSPQQRRARQLVRRVLIGYTAFVILGSVIGALLAQGSGSARLIGGVVGLFVSMVVAAVAARVLRIGESVRSLVHDHPDEAHDR